MLKNIVQIFVEKVEDGGVVSIVDVDGVYVDN